MSSSKNRIAVKGSERFERHGARRVSAPDPNERIEVSVRVRPRNPIENIASVKEQAAELVMCLIFRIGRKISIFLHQRILEDISDGVCLMWHRKPTWLQVI